MEGWWQDPPPATYFQDARKETKTLRSKELDELARVLKANPGRWALVDAARKSSGGGEKYKRRGLEVTTRKRPDGLFDEYVRAPQA